MRAALASMPKWSWIAPLAAWVLLGGVAAGYGGAYLVLVAIALVGSVVAGVHHAEVVAHRLGEPYGTLVLAVAITVIEVGMIVALMAAGGPGSAALARDTVFAAVMIILTGMVGLCLLMGGARHREQAFGLYGTSAALTTLAAIAVLTLVLPNYTVSAPGPAYSPAQLAFIAVISVVLYGTFVMLQTVSHRDYFLPVETEGNAEVHAQPPTKAEAWASAVLMVAALAAVVLCAKALGSAIEAAVAWAGAPKAAVGIVIAAIVLAPEATAALRAARADRLQTSLNLALGSALASIGLSIPTVAVLSLFTGWELALGLDQKSTVLLLLSLFVTTLSLGTGRTTVLQGVVHLVLFSVYLFTTVVP